MYSNIYMILSASDKKSKEIASAKIHFSIIDKAKLVFLAGAILKTF